VPLTWFDHGYQAALLAPVRHLRHCERQDLKEPAQTSAFLLVEMVIQILRFEASVAALDLVARKLKRTASPQDVVRL